MYLVIKCYGGTRVVVGQTKGQAAALSMAERWALALGPSWIVQVVRQ
jgi:hypothetical protein